MASLGQMQASAALPKLHGLLQDKNINLQRAAADALAQIASPESIPILQTVLFDTQAPVPVRLNVLKALGNIGTDEAIAVILDALERQDSLLEFKAYQVLGERKAGQALALLSKRLTQVEQQYREWRKVRDTGREDFTEQETEDWTKRLAEAQPTPYRGFTLAYAIAQIDPQASGITLLSHDLAEVRQGAWMGLGKAGDVELLRLLYPKWRDTDDPIFRVAAYRAIDTILVYLESYGDAEVLQELKAFKNQVKDQDAVATRVEWTLVKLEQREHELAKTPASTH
jgi:HEAT repeat protein